MSWADVGVFIGRVLAFIVQLLLLIACLAHVKDNKEE